MFLLRVYINDEIKELEIELGKHYTIGGATEDSIQISVLGIPKHCFNIQVASDKWVISSSNKNYYNIFKKRTLQFGFEEVLVLDERRKFAVTVYQKADDSIYNIDISKFNELLVGRNSICNIVIDSKHISGKHLRFYHKDSCLCFEDLGSSNGTYLNNRKVTSGILNKDDILSIGFSSIILINNTFTIFGNSIVNINIMQERALQGINNISEPYPWLFKQSPRLKEKITFKDIELQSPVNIGGKPEISWLTVLLMPTLTVAVMLGICFFVTNVMTMLYFSVPMTLIGALMSVVRYRGEKKKYSAKEQKRINSYNKYLEEQIVDIENLLSEQRRILNNDNPAMAQCVDIALGPARTLWDRKYSDTDFMNLRVGSGKIPGAAQIKIPKQMISLEDDRLAAQPNQIANKYAEVDNCPIVIDLANYSSCGIIGNRQKCITLGKNLVVQASVHHSYSDLRIVVICDESESKEWNFIRWLPHIYDNARVRRYFADNQEQSKSLLDRLDDILKQREQFNISSENNVYQLPFYLFICASKVLTSTHPIMKRIAVSRQLLSTGAIFLFDRITDLPKDCYYIAELNDKNNVLYTKENIAIKQYFDLDVVSVERYEKFARYLAPLRIEANDNNIGLPLTVSFLQGYNARLPQMLNVEQLWHNALPERSMAVPIGVRSNGEPFYFDIHEKYSGPHGLVAGMTGSGKSEMVQSWILSMAVHFPPDAVSFVLIDFKGTGLLLPFRNLPHLAGAISDLDTSIERNLIALENELTRRKALLDKYQVSNITAYLKLLHEGRAEESLSYLFVVIDEFAEFKARFPNFMQIVNRIFAVGRTLGIHVLLLTQKPANVVDDKMNANTRFRWCLKVANSADSKDMLKHADAAKITNPGRAFVQVGEDEIFEEIQSYWSGAPYNPYRDLSMQRESKVSIVNLYGERICYEPEKTTGYRAEKNEIDVIVEYLHNYAVQNNIAQARAIWSPRLPETVYLRNILQLAFDGEKWSQSDNTLQPVIGLIDNPTLQSQYPLRLNLSDEGHYVIYGAPGSGKTTLLYTTIMSLALAYTPETVNMYLMDFGGGSLSSFRNLPHVGDVAVGGRDDEKIIKMTDMLLKELEYRKKLLADIGLANIASYHKATGDTLPYIILIVDNFAPLLDLYPDLDIFFQTFTRDGGSFGMYLIATAGAQNAVAYKISQNIKSAITLRMPDKNDYAVLLGRTNGLEPENLPGRGLVRGEKPLEFQTALPADGENEVERIANIHTLIELMNNKWTGKKARPVPIMPERIHLTDYSVEGIFLGLTRKDMSICSIDILQEQFMLLSALTNYTDIWRFICRQTVVTVCPEKIIVFGNSLTGQTDSLTPEKFDKAIADLMPILQQRKDMYKGLSLPVDVYPEILIIIDDLLSCFEQVSNETIRRLTSIVNLGKGLNVILLVAGKNNELTKLYHGGDSLIMNLVKCAISLLIGGSVQAHGIFASDLSFVESTTELSLGDCCLIRQGKAEKIKFAEE